MEKDITFNITPEQAYQLCMWDGVDYEKADSSDICEILNKLIDETCCK